jgi:hypothetical protein
MLVFARTLEDEAVGTSAARLTETVGMGTAKDD